MSIVEVVADVSCAAGHASLVQACLAAFGRLDGLVNNAGINFCKPFLSTTEAEYDRLMNMQRLNDAQGGNLYVRNAIKFGLLKPDSILNDCVMVRLERVDLSVQDEIAGADRAWGRWGTRASTRSPLQARALMRPSSTTTVRLVSLRVF